MGTYVNKKVESMGKKFYRFYDNFNLFMFKFKLCLYCKYIFVYLLYKENDWNDEKKNGQTH